MIKKLLIILGIFLISSCASQDALKGYQMYVNASMHDRPLVKLVAKKGETIELKGVKEFVVYQPSSSSSIKPFAPPPNEALVLTKSFIDATAGILPTYWGWKYGSSVLRKAFDSAGDHYNIGGDYTQGDKWSIGGDYTGADKWTVGQDYVGGSQYQGDYVGGDKNSAGNDYYGSYQDSHNSDSHNNDISGDNGTIGQ